MIASIVLFHVCLTKPMNNPITIIFQQQRYPLVLPCPKINVMENIVKYEEGSLTLQKHLLGKTINYKYKSGVKTFAPSDPKVVVAMVDQALAGTPFTTEKAPRGLR